MERKITGLVAALLLTFGLQAQDGRPAPKSQEEMAKHRTERMTEELGLSKDQVEKVHALNLKDAAEMTERRQERAEKREEQKERSEEARELRRAHMVEREQEMKAILSPEQFAKYQELNSSRAKRTAKPAHDAKPAK